MSLFRSRAWVGRGVLFVLRGAERPVVGCEGLGFCFRAWMFCLVPLQPAPSLGRCPPGVLCVCRVLLCVRVGYARRVGSGVGRDVVRVLVV